MNISAYSYINFSGINKHLKRHYLEDVENIKKVQSTCANNYYAQNITGTIPSGWISNIPKSNRESFIKNIYDILAKYAKEGKGSDEKLLFNRTDDLKNELRKAGLNVCSISPDAIKGAYGGVYKITVKENGQKKDYGLKIFYRNGCGFTSGNHKEQQIGMFIPRIARTNLKKMHFGDLGSGYILSDYVDKHSKQPIKIPPETYGFTFTDDNESNFIGNYIIDYGGFRHSNELISNKNARKKALHLCRLPEEQLSTQWNERFDRIKQSIIIKPTKDNIDEALALSATVTALTPHERKKAALKVAQLIPQLSPELQERIGTTLTSNFHTLSKHCDKYDMLPIATPTLRLNSALARKNCCTNYTVNQFIREQGLKNPTF